MLEPADFAFEPRAENRQKSYDSNWTLDELEAFHINSVFAEEDRNVEKTAKRLGIAKSTLYQKLRALKLA